MNSRSFASRSRLPLRGLGLAAMLVLAFAASPRAAHAVLTIDTATGWNGSDNVGVFGEGGTTFATAGQVVTTDAVNTVLDSFSFRLRTNTGTTLFAAYVLEWDAANSRATGSVLFDSGPQSNAAAATLPFNAFTFNPGIQLVANTQYVLFLSTSQYFDGNPDSAQVGARFDNPYAGGQYVLNFNGGNFGALTTTNWFTGQSNADLAFTAQFSEPTVTGVVPEPSTFAGFALAALGLAAVRFRKRQRA